jgi:hypothetical protein
VTIYENGVMIVRIYSVTVPNRHAPLGLTRVLGTERLATLALVLVLVCVTAQGSRLSAVRWAANHAVAGTLGLGRFDEDDL